MNFNLDIAIVIVYLILTLIIGIWKGRGIKNIKEYAVADRNYPVPILVATIAATWYGGQSLSGVVEKVYLLGVIFIALPWVNFVSKTIIANYLVVPISRFKDAISVGDIMGSIYGKHAKVVTGVAGSLLSIGYIAAQVAAIGYIFEYFLGISSHVGIYIGAIVVVIYSAFGGIKSVTATDVIQFAVILVSVPIIASIALSEAGGLPHLIKALPKEKLMLFPENRDNGLYISLFFIFMFPFLNPAMVQRLLMSRNIKKLQSSFRISAISDLLFYGIVGIIGLCAYVLNPTLEPGHAFAFIVDDLLPIGIKGIAIAGILAMIMSTADSYINSASINIVHDVIEPIFPSIRKNNLLYTKLASIVLGLGSIIMATQFESLIDISLAALDFWGPVIAIPLVFGVLGVRASSETFYASAIAGLIAYFSWKLLDFQTVFGFGALLPAMLANGVVYFSSYYFVDSSFKRKSI